MGDDHARTTLSFVWSLGRSRRYTLRGSTTWPGRHAPGFTRRDKNVHGQTRDGPLWTADFFSPLLFFFYLCRGHLCGRLFSFPVHIHRRRCRGKALTGRKAGTLFALYSHSARVLPSTFLLSLHLYTTATGITARRCIHRGEACFSALGWCSVIILSPGRGPAMHYRRVICEQMAVVNVVMFNDIKWTNMTSTPTIMC